MLPKIFGSLRAPAPGPLSEIVKALDGLSGRPADPDADTVVESYTEIVQEGGKTTMRRVERRVEKGK